MKHTTTIALAVLVMAATGCETAKQKEARGMVKTPAGNWVKKGTPYFGSGVPLKLPPGVFPAYDGSVFEKKPETANPPVIVVARQSGSTVVTQSDGVTTIGNFGARSYQSPPMPPIDTRGNPIYYTSPIGY